MRVKTRRRKHVSAHKLTVSKIISNLSVFTILTNNHAKHVRSIALYYLLHRFDIEVVKYLLLVEVTLQKVNHGKLKFTMVNGTASVTPNFQFTMVNLTLVSCPDNSGKNKVGLTPDNLVTEKKRWVHLLSI